MSYTAAYEMYISIDLKKKMSARLQDMWIFLQVILPLASNTFIEPFIPQ